jgi:hypothetical protein
MSASPVAFGAPKSPAGRKRKPVRGQAASRPRPALAGLALLVAGAGLGATLAVTITSQPASQLSGRGGLLTYAGSLTGMLGTYLALIMVLLVSRIPFVERVAGQDGLLRLHRTIAPWPITLLAAHALLLTLGYAEAARAGAWRRCPPRRSAGGPPALRPAGSHTAPIPAPRSERPARCCRRRTGYSAPGIPGPR